MKTVFAASLALLSGSALAVEQGDWLLHVRAINVSPNDDSSLVRAAGAGVPGTGVTVDDGYSLDISLGYMFTDNWAVELLADLSSEHNVSARGLGALGVPDGTEIADSNVLPPTLFLQYQFNPTSNVRPYLGVGVNFTTFLNDDLSPAAQSVLGASNLDIDNSFGLAAQFGIDFDMDNDWFFNFDVKYIQIDTEATFDSALGPISVDVDINPTVFGVGFGKRF